jgi:hypothetical protein
MAMSEGQSFSLKHRMINWIGNYKNFDYVWSEAGICYKKNE